MRREFLGQRIVLNRGRHVPRARPYLFLLSPDRSFIVHDSATDISTDSENRPSGDSNTWPILSSSHLSLGF